MTHKKILLVGPLPPPVAGTTNSFKSFCSEIKRAAEYDVEILDTSTKKLKQKTRWFSWQTWKHGLQIVYQFLRKIPDREAILIFSTDGFLISIAPLLALISKVFRKDYYIRTFAGSLDESYQSLPKPLRTVVNLTVNYAEGLIVETKHLYKFFHPLFGEGVSQEPNFRQFPDDLQPPPPGHFLKNDALKIVFMSVIKKEKGIYQFLDAVESLSEEGLDLRCDFYGPIYHADQPKFHRRVWEVQGVEYQGIVDFEDVLATLQQYHVLVLPTYHHGEGHPGVVIEAMIAGIPVIASEFRSIPELIEDRVNGLLIQERDTSSLIEAIKLVYNDRELLARMGEENFSRRKQFDVERVVKQILKKIK